MDVPTAHHASPNAVPAGLSLSGRTNAAVHNAGGAGNQGDGLRHEGSRQGDYDDQDNSWETMVAEAGFEPGSIALALSEAHAFTPWSERLAPFSELKEYDNYADSTEFVRRRLDSSVPMFYLAVIGEEVKAVFGLKICHLLEASGERYVALSGEQTHEIGKVVAPDLVGLFSASSEQQDEYLLPKCVLILPDDDIKAALDADTSRTFVDPTPQGAQGQVPENIRVWPVLPVHPAIACFFIKGLPLRKAYQVIQSLKETVPQSLIQDLEPLRQFGRAALTSNGATEAERASSIQTPWSPWKSGPESPESPELRKWYYDLLADAVPQEETGGKNDLPENAEMDRNLYDLIDYHGEMVIHSRDKEVRRKHLDAMESFIFTNGPHFLSKSFGRLHIRRLICVLLKTIGVHENGTSPLISWGERQWLDAYELLEAVGKTTARFDRTVDVLENPDCDGSTEIESSLLKKEKWHRRLSELLAAYRLQQMLGPLRTELETQIADRKEGAPQVDESQAQTLFNKVSSCNEHIKKLGLELFLRKEEEHGYGSEEETHGSDSLEYDERPVEVNPRRHSSTFKNLEDLEQVLCGKYFDYKRLAQETEKLVRKLDSKIFGDGAASLCRLGYRMPSPRGTTPTSILCPKPKETARTTSAVTRRAKEPKPPNKLHRQTCTATSARSRKRTLSQAASYNRSFSPDQGTFDGSGRVVQKHFFTEEEEDAIKSGLRLGLHGKWVNIKNMYPEQLRNRTSRQIKDKVRTWEQNGELRNILSRGRKDDRPDSDSSSDGASLLP